MLSEGICRGYVRPLSRVTYAPKDAVRAFRLLETSGHRGKVLLRMKDFVFNVYPRVICSPDESHLMFWDEGALGVQLTNKLVQRGAKKLYVHSISFNPYKQFKIVSWRKLGVGVITLQNNVDVNDSVSTIINNATALGTIEGICVAITNVFDGEHKEKLTKFINSLDAASRLLCPDLKYFAVVSTVSSVGQDTCIARANNGYKATSLDLSNMSKASSHDLAEAAERALLTTSSVLLAQPAHSAKPDMLKEFFRLAEINVPQNPSLDTTLQQLGMADAKVPIVSSFLNMNYNISLEADSIPKLTLEKLHELVEYASDIVPNNVSGLANFFSTVANEVLLASTDTVMVSTLYKDATLSSDEFDVSKRYLYIVPGMEGHHERFHVLCEHLKLPALVLQPGFDHPTDTVQETAQRFAQILTNKLGIQNNFYLLGYEAGVLVALELAAILEDYGLTGTVFCVGGSPDDITKILEEQLRNINTEEQLQDAVIRHMSRLLVGEDIASLDEVLRDANNWSEKVDACVGVLLGRLQHSTQYVRGIITAALASIKRLRGYVAPAHALRSQIVLLRAASTNVTSSVQELQRYSQRPVAIHQLHTPLSFISNDMECQALVNRYLDTEIKSEFDMLNLCDTYSYKYK
ncbi:hypothetical protein PYW07_008656 [Mythimna separata]|uniref:Ketoreductase (KR) domain-containing protein n=1 Tax=Mythimna separata TaxID=271217 RepID=A0AAD7YD32_MYTSE|nr:hypothetical protein PYW07_008656 [Mythimna separata]